MDSKLLEIPMLINGEEKHTREKIFLKDRHTDEQLVSISTASITDLNYAIKSCHSNLESLEKLSTDEIIAITEKVSDKLVSGDGEFYQEYTTRITGSPYKHLAKSEERTRKFLKEFRSYLDTVFGSYKFLDDGKPIYSEGKQIGIRLLQRRAKLACLFLAGNETALAAFAIPQVIITRTPLIIKGSTVEPISAYRIVKAYYDAGLKNGLNLLFWRALEKPDLANKLLEQSHAQILFGADENILSLTGGIKQAANIVENKHVCPFWTGRSAALVFADADLETAVAGVIEGAHADRGNKCVSTKKVYIERAVFNRFTELLTARIQTLRIGHPLDKTTDIGLALADERQHLQKKLGDEQKVIHHGISENSINISVLLPGPGSEFLREEIPAPVLALVPFNTIEEAIERANASVAHTITKKSLATAVFTRKKENIRILTSKLKTFKILVGRPTTSMNFMLPHQGAYIAEELLTTDKVIEL